MLQCSFALQKKKKQKPESSLNGLLQQNVVRAISQWTTCETLGGEKDWFCGMKYKWERKAYYCFCDKKKKTNKQQYKVKLHNLYPSSVIFI